MKTSLFLTKLLKNILIEVHGNKEEKCINHGCKVGVMKLDLEIDYDYVFKHDLNAFL